MRRQKKIILVFGGSGFIGSHIINNLLKKINKNKYKIINISKKNKYTSPYVSNYLLDLSKIKNIKKVINLKPDYIFYAISLNHFQSEINFSKTMSTNFFNLALILDNEKFTKNIKTINYISTAQVYGDNTQIYSENTMVNPLNKYALTHYLCEEYLRFFY